MPSRAPLLLLTLLLGACVPHMGRLGAPARGGFRLDTESVARVRYAGLVGTPATSTASLTVASGLSRLAPALLVMLKDQGQVDELGARLLECARLAEQQVNLAHFGERAPTRQECGEEVSVDGCDERMTRAMLLGRLKHTLALACARDVLAQLWPGAFSIEQRYRYYPASDLVETISREMEQQLIDQGGTSKLRGTLKPDIVLHEGTDLLHAVLILDFKFPCPQTNPVKWGTYGSSSPYRNQTQGAVYKKALGGKALLISPQRITE